MYEFDIVTRQIKTEGKNIKLKPDEFSLAYLLAYALEDERQQVLLIKDIARTLKVSKKIAELMVRKLQRKGCPIHQINNNGYVWDPNLDAIILEPDDMLDDVADLSARSLGDKETFLKKFIKKQE